MEGAQTRVSSQAMLAKRGVSAEYVPRLCSCQLRVNICKVNTLESTAVLYTFVRCTMHFFFIALDIYFLFISPQSWLRSVAMLLNLHTSLMFFVLFTFYVIFTVYKNVFIILYIV